MARRHRPRRGGAPLLAPLVALLGLIVVAGGSVFAAAKLDLVGGATATATATPPDGTPDPGQTYDPNATDTPGPPATPTPRPTAFVTPPPNEQATVLGTLLYVRNGNIWAVNGTTSTAADQPGHRLVAELERGRQDHLLRPDHAAAWPPDPVGQGHLAAAEHDPLRDGHHVHERRRQRSEAPVHIDVQDRQGLLVDGRHPARHQPGRQDHRARRATAATVPSSDTDAAAVVLSTMSSTGKNLKDMGIDYVGQDKYTPLGHNDPAWSPDGKSIAFTYDAKGGGKGAGVPRIGIIHAPFKKHTPDLSPQGRGYANPAWSPDGRYIAAERITNNSRDIVVLDPDTWEEVARLTTDGESFAPEWSPNGDQIAYLHVNGLDIDARVMTLDLNGNLTLVADQAVTVDGKVEPGVAAGLVHPQGPARRAADTHPRTRHAVAGGDRCVGDRWSVRRSVTDGRHIEPTRYLDRLALRMATTGTSLCLGIDPDPDTLPAGFPRTADGVGRFSELVLEAAAPFAAAVKVNVAFFERWGSDGVRALERLRARDPAGLPFIADAKRGDIGSTAAQYAVALYDSLGADAVTASPYLGSEAICAPARPTRPVRLPAVPDLQPRCPRAPGPGGRGGPGVGRARRAAGAPGRAAGQRLGTPHGHRRPGRWAPPHPRRWPSSVPSRPGCRSSCPGSAPRVATRTRRCGTAPWPRAPRASRSAGRCS